MPVVVLVEVGASAWVSVVAGVSGGVAVGEETERRMVGFVFLVSPVRSKSSREKAISGNKKRGRRTTVERGKQLRGGDGVRQGERGKKKEKKKKGSRSPRQRITMDAWQWCIGPWARGGLYRLWGWQGMAMHTHHHSLTRIG